METVKLSSRGQIFIPKQMREIAHLTVGMEFSVTFEDGGIKLRPLPTLQSSSHDEAAGCLYRASRRALSDTETEAAIGILLQEQDRVAASS